MTHFLNLDIGIINWWDWWKGNLVQNKTFECKAFLTTGAPDIATTLCFCRYIFDCKIDVFIKVAFWILLQGSLNLWWTTDTWFTQIAALVIYHWSNIVILRIHASDAYIFSSYICKIHLGRIGLGKLKNEGHIQFYINYLAISDSLRLVYIVETLPSWG